MDFSIPRVFKRYRNTFLAALSGIIFSFGWWIAIDAAARYPLNKNLIQISHVSGALGTLAFIMLNSVNLRDESNFLGKLTKPWLFVTFLLSFFSIISALWLFFDYYVYKKNYFMPGLQILIQNIFILLASFLFKFGRTEDVWN